MIRVRLWCCCCWCWCCHYKTKCSENECMTDNTWWWSEHCMQVDLCRCKCIALNSIVNVVLHFLRRELRWWCWVRTPSSRQYIQITMQFWLQMTQETFNFFRIGSVFFPFLHSVIHLFVYSFALCLSFIFILHLQGRKYYTTKNTKQQKIFSFVEFFLCFCRCCCCRCSCVCFFLIRFLFVVAVISSGGLRAKKKTFMKNTTHTYYSIDMYKQRSADFFWINVCVCLCMFCSN